jgi:hypothetical protein
LGFDQPDVLALRGKSVGKRKAGQTATHNQSVNLH